METVNCPMKRFNCRHNVGSAKYVVNFHDGIKTHPDGSPFFDIALFNNRKKRDMLVRQLLREGYVEQ